MWVGLRQSTGTCSWDPLCFLQLSKSSIQKLAPANCPFPPHPHMSAPALPPLPTLILSAQTPLLSSPFPPAVPTGTPSLAPSWDSSRVCRLVRSKGRAGQGSRKQDKAEGALKGICVTVKQLSLKKQGAGKWTKDEVFSSVTFLIDCTILDWRTISDTEGRESTHTTNWQGLGWMSC